MTRVPTETPRELWKSGITHLNVVVFAGRIRLRFRVRHVSSICALLYLVEVDPYVSCVLLLSPLVQMKMTRRTMGDGSFVKLLTPDNLHPDLGSRDVMDMVRTPARKNALSTAVDCK